MSSTYDDMTVTVPEAACGNWRVERFEISKEESAFGIFSFKARTPPAGVYTRLMHGGELVMSDTPAEKRDHCAPVFEARRRGGRVLLHGLGLGMVLQAVQQLENVSAIDVVEIDKDVIKLVGPHYSKDKRVTIYHADALTRVPEKGRRWSVVWHDIWPNLCEDNLDEMKLLHRRYGRRCDWQGSWGRALIEYQRRRTADAFWR